MRRYKEKVIDMSDLHSLQLSSPSWLYSQWEFQTSYSCVAHTGDIEESQSRRKEIH